MEIAPFNKPLMNITQKKGRPIDKNQKMMFTVRKITSENIA